MASQITHVVYAKKIFDTLGSDLDWDEFLVGTLFPDIRRLAKLSRNQTHRYSLSRKDLDNKTAFETGFLTHSYVDERREQYLETKEPFKKILASSSANLAAKLVEDELVFNQFANWENVITTLETIYPEELKATKDEKVVRKWHEYLQFYFKNGPSDKILIQAMEKLGTSQELQAKVMKWVKKIRSDKDVLTIIRDTINHI